MKRRICQVTAVVVMWCSSVLSLRCDAPGLGRPNPDFLVIGHRGAPKIAAENTIAAFDVALAVGANAIELDVCITEDSVPVIWHDRDPDSAVAVARQNGVEGLAYVPLAPPRGSTMRRPVAGLTLAELREHYGYGDLSGRRNLLARIPTLEETLDFARTQHSLKAIYVDIKFDQNQLYDAQALVTQLHAAQTNDEFLSRVDFYLMSVHRSIVDVMERERLALGAHALRVVWDFEQAGALDATLGASLRDVSTGLVPTGTWSSFKKEVATLVNAREKGELDTVTVWTFDRDMQLAELLYYGVDGVMTNEPDKLYGIWQDTLD